MNTLAYVPLLAQNQTCFMVGVKKYRLVHQHLCRVYQYSDADIRYKCLICQTFQRERKESTFHCQSLRNEGWGKH